MSRFVVIDGCPVPSRLAPAIQHLKRAVPTAVLQSCYRGKRAAGLLHQHGKHTQAELYDGWIHHRPGFLPANPPGRSTHELRSDGVPYRGPVGRPLRYWQVGLDFNDQDVDALIHHAAIAGWDLYRPYSSGSEAHHINFRRRPKGRFA